MEFGLNKSDISEIEKVLDVKVENFLGNDGNITGGSWMMSNKSTEQSLLCKVYNSAGLSDAKTFILVSVQTKYGYFELHDCTKFMIFEPDEIIFLATNETQISSIIIGKQVTCSMYSNVSKDILGADFSKLDPAVLLSAMQLSLAESVLI